MTYRFFIRVYAWLALALRKQLMRSEAGIALLYFPGLSRLREFNGKVFAYTAFLKAKRSVPAYRAFLDHHNRSNPKGKTIDEVLSAIPVTDKENYIRVYSIEERCVNGRIPASGVVIDESSGSSGTAVNWVRGETERKRNARFIRFGIRRLFGKGPLFIINAFALGPWATGVNITMGCVEFSKLKSLGPDMEKIVNTLLHFGKTHTYLVMGYPPFLKSLVDHSTINWHEYDVSFIFGGEAMSEEMRDYLNERGIRKIYSSIGASDLELNMAAENDFTIGLRKLMRVNPVLRQALLRHEGALPMIFQYNPADFLVETTAEGELVVTICRPDYLSPKIRYNLHDRGHVVSLETLFLRLREAGIDPGSLPAPPADLPLLFHYGRSDMVVSFFGANIAPQDVQEAVFNVPELARLATSFFISVAESEHGDKKLVVHFELVSGKTSTEVNSETVSGQFFSQLAKINQDFREARRMLPPGEHLVTRFFEHASGPFSGNDKRIKTRYIRHETG